MNLSIVILSYNTKNLTKQCLSSIFRYPPKGKFEVIVVDNASKDGSCEMIKKEFPQIKLILNKRNQGYSKANNQGLKLAKSNLIILLNSDTKVQKETFEKLLDFYRKNPKVGAVVPKLLNPDGSTQYFYHRRLPNLKYQIASLIYNYTPFKKFGLAQDYFLLKEKFKTNTQIEQAAGVCILTTKKVVKKIGGLFDEKLSIFLNDVDYSFRLKKHNLPIYLVAQSNLIHYRSSSTNQLDPYTLRQEVILSTLYYLKKNSNFLSYALVKVLILILLFSIFLLTFLGLAKKYLMTPINNKKLSLEKQWENLTAIFIEKRNHPGLIAQNN